VGSKRKILLALAEIKKDLAKANPLLFCFDSAYF
jgi:hypothetical protein